MHKLIMYFQVKEGQSGYHIDSVCGFVHKESEFAWFKSYKDALRFIELKSREISVPHDNLVEDQRRK